MRVMSEVENPETTSEKEEEYFLPPASLDTLVRSVVAQAQFALVGFETEKGKHEPDLRVARHYIDLLAVIQEKTRGNLTMDEQRLVENSLTELRFRYIQAFEDSRKKAASQAESAKA